MVDRVIGKYIVWGSSIAMSWMWGLGLFFSVHFTFLYGWPGLLGFAVPSAFGLLLFGFLCERRAAGGSLRRWVETAFERYAPVFALYQIAAVALTLFALIAYFFVPLGIAFPAFAALAVLFLGILVSELAGIGRLARLHAVYLVLALLAIVWLLARDPWPVAAAERGNPSMYAGFLVPLVTGLVFGPFYDLQQWQRAVEMRERGLSVFRGFAAGAAIFFALLLLNGILAMQLAGGLGAEGFLGADGIIHAQAAISTVIHQAGGLPLALYTIWVLLCILTTFDSAQAAFAWFNARAYGKSDSLILHLVPEALLKSTLPAFLLAAAAALAVWALDGHIEYFMILYASFFVPYSSILARDLWRTGALTSLSSASFLTGLFSLLLMSFGYFNELPLAMIAAALVSLLPLLFDRGAKLHRADAEAPGSAETAAPPDQDAPARRDAVAGPIVASAAEEARPAPVYDPDGSFDGKWFEIKLTATYADTNSVGNIYFASYISWVGKARELFFRRCMPDFDLKSTPFFILTRDFRHKFVREAREFEEIIIRLRVKSTNRKFVKLEHKLLDGRRTLLGEGEQSLMFVKSEDYCLTDLPSDVLVAFGPYL